MNDAGSPTTPTATRAITEDPCGGPYALKATQLREQRLSHVEDAHMAPLHALVGQIRAETSKHENVPTFDPCDGGINAAILLLLEAPGPKTIETGLVSLNNPDDTAANLYNLLEDARIARHHILMWNVVPWYLGRTDRSRIRPATCKDIVAASPYLSTLVRRLADLKACVLLGNKAQAAEPLLRALVDVPVIASPHPSPRALRPHPENHEAILRALRQAKSVTSTQA